VSRVLDIAAYVDDMMDYVANRNVGYLVILLHLFVYGLYYKQIREPMMKVLKQTFCRNLLLPSHEKLLGRDEQ